MVLHYVLGDDDIRGIAYKCYIAGGFTAKNINTASASAYSVLRRPNVKAAIAELRAELETEFKAKMRSWAAMAVRAQELLHRAVETALDPEYPEPLRVEPSTELLMTVKETLDRALGKPKQTLEHEIGDKLDDVIKRLSGDRKPRAALPAPDTNFIGEVREGEMIPRGDE